MQKTTLQIVKDDPYLEPFQTTFYQLHDKMNKTINQFQSEGGITAISSSYLEMGLHPHPTLKNTYVYKEWAPSAQEITIFGEFNDWDRNKYRAEKVKDKNIVELIWTLDLLN